MQQRKKKKKIKIPVRTGCNISQTLPNWCRGEFHGIGNWEGCLAFFTRFYVGGPLIIDHARLCEGEIAIFRGRVALAPSSDKVRSRSRDRIGLIYGWYWNEYLSCDRIVTLFLLLFTVMKKKQLRIGGIFIRNVKLAVLSLLFLLPLRNALVGRPSLRRML